MFAQILYSKDQRVTFFFLVINLASSGDRGDHWPRLALITSVEYFVCCRFRYPSLRLSVISSGTLLETDSFSGNHKTLLSQPRGWQLDVLTTNRTHHRRFAHYDVYIAQISLHWKICSRHFQRMLRCWSRSGFNTKLQGWEKILDTFFWNVHR